VTSNDELRRLAIAVAREAGDMVATGRRGAQLHTTSKSSPTDMVTQFDTASEALVVRRLTEARPDDGLVGEEGSSTPGTSGISWLVDPIDGTTNFLYDLPGWAVSIAAVGAEGTLAGAVYVPSRGEVFSAARGDGAWLDDRPISCSTTTELAHALVATGFGYAPERRMAQAWRVAGMIGRVRDIRRLGAASVDLCHVACGRVDAYFEEGLGPWDLAAGELVAREAGCRSGDFHGGPVRPAEALVAPPALFDDLAALVRDATSAAASGGPAGGFPVA
jgi:myo-inositol-1(or 4)-monophosphatase